MSVHEIEKAKKIHDTKKAQLRAIGLRSMREILEGVYARVTGPTPARGVPCGHDRIDYFLAGFRRQRVCWLGAETSWGKSSFAIMTLLAGEAAKKKTVLITTEDGEDMYGQRFMAARARINALAIRDHETTGDDQKRMIDAINAAQHLPFFYHAVGKSIEAIAGDIKLIGEEHRPDLYIIDYLQAISTSKATQDRRNEITHIARTMTDAVKAANGAGLFFSQLRRLENGKRPDMHSFKESGDIENMAEHVLIGYESDGKRYLSIEKNKDGPKYRSPIEMPFDEVTASFVQQTGFRKPPRAIAMTPAVASVVDEPDYPIPFEETVI